MVGIGLFPPENGFVGQHEVAQLSLGLPHDFSLHIDHIVKIISTIGVNLSLKMMTAKINQTNPYFSTSQYIPKKFILVRTKFFHINFVIKVRKKLENSSQNFFLNTVKVPT